MHEQDDEADAGADGDGDGFAGDGAGVGLLGRAAGEGFAGVDRFGAVWVGGEGGAFVVVAGVPVEIILGAHHCEYAGDDESEPEQEVARDVGAGVDGAAAGQEHDDVGRVPGDGEAEGDEFPGQEPVFDVGGPLVVGVVVAVVDVAREDELVGEGPAEEADGGDGEDDGEGAEDEFPEEFGVVGVHVLAGGTGFGHGWGSLGWDGEANRILLK